MASVSSLVTAREETHTPLDLPTHLSINAIVAIGKPAEEVILEEARSPEDAATGAMKEGVITYPSVP